MKKILVFLIVLTIFFLELEIKSAEMIDINSASLEQLDNLIGIGPIYAQRIIEGRPYTSLDDLLKIKGIGPATLQKIKEQGLACINCSTQENQNYNPSLTEDKTAISTSTKNTTLEIFPSGIYINEILPNPEGSDGTDEWIELYISNNFEADISSWKLEDKSGTIKTYSLPINTKLPANGFLILKRPETKIMLNNDEDGLNLFTPDAKIIDSVNYTKAPLGQSYNKVLGKWLWSKTPTPAAKNIISVPVVLPKTKKSVNNKETGLADISQSIKLNQDNKAKNPWFLFFTTLTITLISALIVLLFRYKFLKHET